jgi:uncharacterized glyoxalase superfamily protein PhnB
MDEPVFTAALHYRDPKAAVAWLERAFGFETTMAIEAPDGDPTMCHYELGLGGRGGRIMVGGEWTDHTRSPASVGGVNTQTTYAALAGDIDAHYERARAAGAVIVAEPQDEFYGDRTYRAADPEGHVWGFSTKVREVSKAEAEAAINAPIQAKNWA